MIPAKLLTDIDNASPPELWDLLTILSELLEERGDLRADGIRWLRENKREPYYDEISYEWSIEELDEEGSSGLPMDWFYLDLIPEKGFCRISSAYLAAAQAFADARYGTEATEPAN